MLYRVSEEVRKAQRILGREGVTDKLHWLYRCTSCARLLTKLEILEAWSAGRVNLCPCGAKTIRPTNAKWWEELFLPRCWKVVIAIHFRLVAPAPAPQSASEQAEADRLGRAATRAFDKQMSELVRKKELVTK